MFFFVVLPDVMTPKITMTKHLQQLAKTINLNGVSDVFGKATSTHSGSLPSGKRLHNYGTSPFSMGKSTISMVIFNSFLLACYLRAFCFFPPPKRCHLSVQHTGGFSMPAPGRSLDEPRHRLCRAGLQADAPSGFDRQPSSLAEQKMVSFCRKCVSIDTDDDLYNNMYVYI